jgi:hypothetical protein
VFHSLLLLAPFITACGAHVCFTNSLTPQIISVNPGVVLVGGSQTQLTIIGRDFGPETIVILEDGTELRPSIRGSQLFIPVGPFPAPGVRVIRLFDPCGGFSSSFTLRILI